MEAKLCPEFSNQKININYVKTFNSYTKDSSTTFKSQWHIVLITAITLTVEAMRFLAGDFKDKFSNLLPNNLRITYSK